MTPYCGRSSRWPPNCPNPGFGTDPLGEFQEARGSGLLRKYQGRLLIVTTGACGVHCRFCFRRHFPYQNHRRARSRPAGLDGKRHCKQIAADLSICEVILSGGDPLTLPDDVCAFRPPTGRNTPLTQGREFTPVCR